MAEVVLLHLLHQFNRRGNKQVNPTRTRCRWKLGPFKSRDNNINMLTMARGRQSQRVTHRRVPRRYNSLGTKNKQQGSWVIQNFIPSIIITKIHIQL